MSRRRQSSFWRLFGFLKGRRLAYVTSILGASAITTGERIFIGYIVKVFTDAITTGDMVLLRRTLVYWILSYLAFIAIGPFALYAWRSTVYRVTTDLREALFAHLQRLPLAYHERRHSGDVLSVLTNDVSAAEQAYRQDLYTLVESSMMGLSAAVFMLLLDWKLALLIILSGLAPLVANALFAKPLRRAGQEVQARLGTVSERLSDLLAGYQVVRTYSLAEWIAERFARANGEVLDSSLRRVRLQTALTATNGFAGLVQLLSYYGGAYMVLTGQTTFGLVMGLTQLNNQIAYLMYSLGGTISRIQGALAAVDRLLAVLDAAPEPERYAPVPASAGPAPAGTAGLAPSPHANVLLSFRDVWFSYDRKEGETETTGQGQPREVLKGMSFDVRPGQVVAFVGPSGGGKSTLFKLLLGGYPIVKGAGFVSGRSIAHYPLGDLRDRFAYVPQDAYLYAGSVMENIRYGRPDASDGEVMAAARAAYAHDFVSALPEGYETKVGERGAKLSGGERQRIAIARALLKDAPILLLDEATSSLDSESEHWVQQALATLMRGRTTLVIAHRLSTIERADVIYVVDEGRIVEQGRQDELLARDGLYRRLYEMQFKSPASSLKTDCLR
jgi:ATP-binding cassette subfamily B protein